MIYIEARNVNGAFREVVRALSLEQIKPREITRVIKVRGQEVVEFDSPVITAYRHPGECVLWSPVRRANPFFHLLESIWMLAGRDDVKFLTYFNKNMSNFSDNGETFHGAYGKRWISDGQIQNVVSILQDDPNSRRAVIAMYDRRVDSFYVGKDLPCNTHVYFSIRNNRLDMTVCCRSNDIFWGAYGANAVHFSFLQQFVAARLGATLGTYRQFSNNFHVYTTLYDLLDKVTTCFTLAATKGQSEDSPSLKDLQFAALSFIDLYEADIWPTRTESMFERDTTNDHFLNLTLAIDRGAPSQMYFPGTFAEHLVTPLYNAWKAHKEGNTTYAFEYLCDCLGVSEPARTYYLDWYASALSWLAMTGKIDEARLPETASFLGSTYVSSLGRAVQ